MLVVTDSDEDPNVIPLQIGTVDGSVELSPSTAEADTDGMCGFALTVFPTSSGLASKRLMVVGLGVSSSKLTPIPSVKVESSMFGTEKFEFTFGFTLSTKEEEDVSETRVTIGADENYISSMQKGGESSLKREEVDAIIDMSEKLYKKIFLKIEKFVK